MVDWNKGDKEDYLLAMERSPIRDTEIKHVLKRALTPDTDNRQVFMKRVGNSDWYEGYNLYRTADLVAQDS